MPMPKLFLLIIIIFIIKTTSLSGQPSQVGIIDFYGVVSKQNDLKKCLPFSENDTLIFFTETAFPIAKKKIIDCLLTQDNIKQADISFICCHDKDKWIVFVGADTIPAKAFKSTKQADIKLPLEMKSTYDSLMDQIMIAVENGQASENDSNGHALMDYLPARDLQEKFIIYANKNLNLLKDVLKNSNDHEQRAAAASIIAYYQDKDAIIDDLLHAVSDADEIVRNNAMRAIGIIADYSNQQPQLKIKIPVDPFINMMNSISWTDRNKSSFVLLALTTNRDIKVLDQLKRKALQPIVDMANWKSEGHFMPGYLMLGRIAGWTDQEIMDGTNQRMESIKKMLAQINN